MPVTFEFAESGTCLVSASGSVTYEEVEDVIGLLLADDRMRSGARILADCRYVASAPATAELKSIAHDLSPLVQRGMGPVAVVTDSIVVYGIARMFSVFAEAFRARVMPFRCFEDARSWLETESRAA